MSSHDAAPGVLSLPDLRDAADLEMLLGRARAADPDGAVRLHASGRVLAVTVCLVPGSGLLGAGLVLGMRAMALAAEADVDVVVAVDAVNDRLARMRREQSTSLSLPPVQLRVPWSAVAPPRSGWESRGVLDLDGLRRCARDGIAEITRGAPEGSGAAAVADLRRRVWGRPMAVPSQAADAAEADESAESAQSHVPLDGADPGPAGEVPVAGLAFGAHVLGFLSGGPATWHTCGQWQRLSTPVGHVLAR